MNEQLAWIEANNRYLAATLAWLRQGLGALAGADGSAADPVEEASAFERAKTDMLELESLEPPPALVILSNALGLSEFDRRVLALCMAMELDSRIPGLCAEAQRNAGMPYPTFALAFELFDDPDWSALTPHGPLRHWRLLDINQPTATPVTTAALSLDERVLNYLKGLNYLDDRLSPMLDPALADTGQNVLPLSQQRLVDDLVRQAGRRNGQHHLPIIELQGRDSTSKQLIASHTASSLGLSLQVLQLAQLPSNGSDFETFTRLWERESLLLPLALYVDWEDSSEAESSRLARFLKRSSGMVFIAGNVPGLESPRRHISVEVCKPTAEEQVELWTNALQTDEIELPARLAEQFSFNGPEISRLAAANQEAEPIANARTLWRACRGASRTSLDELAQHIDARADWDLMVLPEDQLVLLRQINNQVAQRSRVYRDWGFGQRLNRGLGINALFFGESGTGKSMAAEVIANELNLDLYRIDLSAVVSKYIGETEKNLRRLFDSAEDSGAILFFDEADALFGKRSEVKDSHDRYANIEINYLLQRMENYRGLAILATNMKSAMDQAFLRRLRFIVEFPFPDTAGRREIWRRSFPSKTPTDPALDYERLAKLQLTGGNIHSIALNAAFLAADDGQCVTMPLILEAARAEFRKLERPAKDSDFDYSSSQEIAL
jgi:hypothetical protein